MADYLKKTKIKQWLKIREVFHLYPYIKHVLFAFVLFQLYRDQLYPYYRITQFFIHFVRTYSRSSYSGAFFVCWSYNSYGTICVRVLALAFVFLFSCCFKNWQINGYLTYTSLARAPIQTRHIKRSVLLQTPIAESRRSQKFNPACRLEGITFRWAISLMYLRFTCGCNVLRIARGAGERRGGKRSEMKSRGGGECVNSLNWARFLLCTVYSYSRLQFDYVLNYWKVTRNTTEQRVHV